MRLLLPIFCCVFFGTAFIDAQQSPAPTAGTLTGPVTGGKGQAFGALIAQELAASHFTEAEYFVSGGLKVQHVIATGRSQSAFRLITYINAVQRSSRVFDGFLIHSRGANAAGLSAEQLNRDPDPIVAGAHLRDDVGVPVVDLQDRR
jgi:hypothetical protein